MRQHLTARAGEDEQGNVHVNESEDVMKEEEEDLDKIMGEVREALTITSVCEFSTTTTATRISSKVDYQFCYYHSLIAISIHLAMHHQK